MNVSNLFSRVERSFDYVENGIVYAGIALFVAVNLLAIFQIFMRYVGGGLLDVSTQWTEEVARYLLVVMVFVGAPYAMRNNDNISIRPLFRLLPTTAQKVLITFSNVLIIVFSVLVVFSVTAVLDRTLNVTLATVSWLSVGYAHIVLGVMFAFVILFAIEETVNTWRFDEAPMADATDDGDVADEDIAILNRDGEE
jgi:TRAP-type C4-dicarboxylate transport system permease small subunit